jgi:hypothetical protein
MRPRLCNQSRTLPSLSLHQALTPRRSRPHRMEQSRRPYLLAKLPHLKREVRMEPGTGKSHRRQRRTKRASPPHAPQNQHRSPSQRARQQQSRRSLLHFREVPRRLRQHQLILLLPRKRPKRRPSRLRSQRPLERPPARSLPVPRRSTSPLRFTRPRQVPAS